MNNQRQTQKVLDTLPKIIEWQDKQLEAKRNKDYAKAINIVHKFIKERKRILYGGLAIDVALKKHGQAIYDPKYTFPDYDFYSPSHIEDSIIICNKLYDAGFQYTRRVPALSEGTVKIQIDFTVFVADITYMDPHEYKNLSTNTVNGLRYVTPDYIKINSYLSISHAKNCFRWKKDCERLTLLNKYYPIKLETGIKVKVPKNNNGLVQDLLNYLITNEEMNNNTIFQGYIASIIFQKQKIDKFTGTLEIICTDQIDNYIDNILVFLTKSKQIDLDKHYIMYDTYHGESLPQKFVVRVVKKKIGGYTTAEDDPELLKSLPLAVIYNLQGQRCPFVKIDKLNCKIVGYTYLLYYLYIYYSYRTQVSKKIGKTDTDFATFYDILCSMYENVSDLIIKLENCRKKYLKKHKLIGYEEFIGSDTQKRNIFQIMSSNLDNETKQFEFIKKYINTRCTTYPKSPWYPVYTPDIDRVNPVDCDFKYPEKMIKICLVSNKPDTEDQSKQQYGSFFLVTNIYYGPPELRPKEKIKTTEESETEESETEELSEKRRIVMYPYPIEELTYRRIIIA